MNNTETIERKGDDSDKSAWEGPSQDILENKLLFEDHTEMAEWALRC